MSKEKRRVPKLRFPGFTEDWEQRKFNDLFKERREKTIKENEETLLSCAITGIYLNSELFSHFRGSSTIGYLKIKKYDLILSAQNLHLGNANINLFFENGMISPAYKVFELKSIDPYFINAWVKKDATKNFFLKATTEGASQCRKNIEWDVLLNQEIPVPNNLEQIAIGKFINKLDMNITLHQRKLNNLKLKKKALLQKLFPKNGERYPELRFPGFTDAWEQCKLGEIFEYLQNNTLSRDSLNYKIPNIKNIHYGDILVKFNEILDGSNNDIPYINPDLDLSKFSKSLLRDGDVIFSDTAEDDTVGKAIELQNVNAPFILSGLHTIPCRPLIPFGKGYLGNFFNSNSYRLQIRPLVQGIKVSSISKSALKDTMIKYPKNLDEQEKIGNLFQSITKMITLHQRKLDHLQLQKKALLQQMFV